jgi:hypothetical protein
LRIEFRIAPLSSFSRGGTGSRAIDLSSEEQHQQLKATTTSAETRTMKKQTKNTAPNGAREEPGPRQLSVWDFGRPPEIVQWHEKVVVNFGGVAIAETTEAWCILETSHPPTYYLPRSCFVPGSLRPAKGSSFCEWKASCSNVLLI